MTVTGLLNNLIALFPSEDLSSNREFPFYVYIISLRNCAFMINASFRRSIPQNFLLSEKKKIDRISIDSRKCNTGN